LTSAGTGAKRGANQCKLQPARSKGKHVTAARAGKINLCLCAKRKKQAFKTAPSGGKRAIGATFEFNLVGK